MECLRFIHEESFMVISFEAKMLDSGLDEENDPFFYIFVADAAHAHYLTFQRSPPDSEEDDGIYAEVDDQAFGGYDRVLKCGVLPDGITVDFVPALGSRGQVKGVAIRFAPGIQPSPEFLGHLRTIFTGKEDRLRIIDGGGKSVKSH